VAQSPNKTVPTEADVAAFLASVEHPGRRADAQRLDALFREVTGWQPRLWGGSLIGYGRYHYVYASGREGDFLATGFAPRKANLSIHILPGYQDHSAILARLGKHKTGKSCLYVTRLSDIDLAVLAELIRTGLDDLAARYPVSPT
jgi:hypothetical protein